MGKEERDKGEGGEKEGRKRGRNGRVMKEGRKSELRESEER